MANPKHITEKQANWFNRVREGLEKDTGKTFTEWVEVAKTCPERSHKLRLKWFKDVHGIGVNRASVVLGEAFETGLGWDNPEGLLSLLWKNPELRAVYNVLETYVKTLGEDVVVGPRKTFSGFSRNYQFAAARPVKGKVRLGLAVNPDEHDLERAKSSDSWSDRLTSVIVISSPDEINNRVKSLIQIAWKNS